MSKVRQTYDDEIDLFDLFKTLWDSKWLITAFSMIAVLVGSGLIYVKDSVYESKLIYSIDTIPPFYEEDKVFADFEYFFYSKSIFEEWKKGIGKTSLIFEDFSNTKVFDGVVVVKNEQERLATLGLEMVGPRSRQKGDTFILVKTNQLAILDAFFKYANHINRMLKEKSLVRANDEINILESHYKNLQGKNNNNVSSIVHTLLSIDRFVVSAEKGTNLLKIRHPTIPKKISPISSQILLISGVLGWMIGVFFVFIRNAIRKRKEQLAKA